MFLSAAAVFVSSPWLKPGGLRRLRKYATRQGFREEKLQTDQITKLTNDQNAFFTFCSAGEEVTNSLCKKLLFLDSLDVGYFGQFAFLANFAWLVWSVFYKNT